MVAATTATTTTNWKLGLPHKIDKPLRHPDSFSLYSLWHGISLEFCSYVPFFVRSIITVADIQGDFYLCIPLNILHQLMYDLACNEFLPGFASVLNMPRCLSQSVAPKRPAPKGPAPKLIHGYTPLIGPEAWLSTMGKRRMYYTSTSVFYPLPHPQIRTSAFHHRP